MEIIFLLALGLYSIPTYTMDIHNNMLYEENYQIEVERYKNPSEVGFWRVF
jgi:hypothetical protein